MIANNIVYKKLYNILYIDGILNTIINIVIAKPVSILQCFRSFQKNSSPVVLRQWSNPKLWKSKYF